MANDDEDTVIILDDVAGEIECYDSDYEDALMDHDYGDTCDSNVSNQNQLSNKQDKSVQTGDHLLENYLEELYGDETTIDDLNLCTICMDPWTLEGSHRIICLKCGHLFGESCIVKLLKSIKIAAERKCPICDQLAKKGEIRKLYAKGIIAIDKSEETRIQEEARKELKLLATLNEQKNFSKTNLEFVLQQLQEAKVSRKRVLDKLERLKAKKKGLIMTENSGLTSHITEPTLVPIAEQPKPRLGNFKPITSTEIVTNGDCRILAVSEKNCIIVVSQKSNIPLFDGYGIRNIGPVDWKPKKFLPLHKSQIKDISFHPDEPVVLTGSLDKTVKITNVLHSSTLQTCIIDDGVWSCCWNKTDPRYFYIGLRNGKVLEFDQRMNQCPVNELVSCDRTPVCSLTFVNNNSMDGIVSTRLRSCECYIKKNDSYETISLPVIGNFMSSHYDSRSSKLLLSSRPLRSQTNVTHSTYQLSINSNNDGVDEEILLCEPKEKYLGGTRSDQVIRGKIFPHPSEDGASLITVGDQDTGGFLIWDTNSTEPLQKVKGLPLIFDFSLLRISDSNPHLIALSENKIFSYKWSL